MKYLPKQTMVWAITANRLTENTIDGWRKADIATQEWKQFVRFIKEDYFLSKKEIEELADAESKKGLTVVPLEWYNAGRYVKLRLAIVKGKGKADRREDLKRQTDMREAERALKHR